MGFASKEKHKLKDIALFDQESIDELIEHLPAVNLTPEQIAEIASQIPGGLTINQIKADTDLADAISKKHASGSDDQNLANYVQTNDSRLSDSRPPTTHTHPNDHAPESDNQDLSGLQPKETGKGLYPDVDATKLSGIEANAQANNISDVNAGLLTGGQETTLHSHASSGGGLTQQQIMRLI